MRRGSWVVSLVAPLLLVTAAVLGTASPVLAAPAYPRPAGRCVDTAGVLGARLCAKVTAVLLRGETRTADEIAVAVVPTTGAASIEAWSTGLFNSWGVGKKDRNNGVLLVVAVDDRRLRLETGRGMAQRLSDSAAKNIIDTVITPRFASGSYAEGILAGLDEVRRHLGHAVPRDARLLPLVAFAATPAAPAPPAAAPPAAGGSMGEDPTGGDYADDDGEPFDEGDYQDMGGDSGLLPDWVFLSVPLAIVFLVMLGFVVFTIVALAARRSTLSGDLTNHRPGYGRPTGWHARPVRHSSVGTGSHTWSSGGGSSSDSSSSSSSFGGGSSDGGGSSGSW